MNTKTIRIAVTGLIAFLAGVAGASGLTVTVGPAGDFATLQEAATYVDETLGNLTCRPCEPGDAELVEIRLQPGNYLADYPDWLGSLKMSGGWNDSFDVQMQNPTLTTVRRMNRRFSTLSPFRKQLSNLTFSEQTFLDWSGDLLIENVHFTENSGTFDLVFFTGGSLVLRDVLFSDNEVATLLYALVFPESQVVVENVKAVSNLRTYAGGDKPEDDFSGLFDISLQTVCARDYSGESPLGEGSIHLRNVQISETSFEDGHTAPLIDISSLPRDCDQIHPPLRATAERLQLEGGDSERPLLRALLFAHNRVAISDSLLTKSSDWAVEATATDESRIRLTNLTVTKNARGVHMFATSDASVALNNSVVTFNDEADVNAVGPTTFLSNNWVGVDPGFVDPDSSDYRLRLDAPAIDTGRRGFRSGLGNLDLDGNARIAGWEVDPGAYEAQTGTPPSGPNIPPCLASSTATINREPAWYDTPACNCFLDASHPTTQCSLDIPGWPGLELRFFTPELALDPKKPPQPGGWQILSKSGDLPFVTTSTLDSSLGSEVLSSVSGTATVKPSHDTFHWPKELGKEPLLRSVLYFGSEKLGQELAVEVLLDPEQLVDPK